MARVYKNVFFPDDLGSRNPVFHKKIAEMCYLYRRTGPKVYFLGRYSKMA